MRKEIWKDIPGFRGLYKISNNGRVLSLAGKKQGFGITKSDKVLNPLKRKRGYLQINLYKNPNRLTPKFKGEFLHKKYIHILVAKGFVPNPLNLPQVNHNDRIKSNNYDWNLSWVDAQGNADHAIANGGMQLSKTRKTRYNYPPDIKSKIERRRFRRHNPIVLYKS